MGEKGGGCLALCRRLMPVARSEVLPSCVYFFKMDVCSSLHYVQCRSCCVTIYIPMYSFEQFVIVGKKCMRANGCKF